MGLDISLLGPPLVTVDGEPFRVDTRKATAVLAYLACSPGPVSRETLAAMLWPEADAERSRAVLRRTLSALRSGLGDAARLDTTRHDLAIARSGDTTIDLRRFDELVAAGDTDSLVSAARLYRGTFMAGFSLRGSAEFDDWMMATAAIYERSAARVFERLAIGLREADRLDDAMAATTRWLELDPLHEPAYRTLMELQGAAGDRAAAVKTFRRCVRVFRDELGVSPLPETTEVYRHIIEGSTAPAPTPAGVQTTGRPQPAAFVGRSKEIGLAAAAYREAGTQTRTLVVSGEAGIGKTRFVTEFVSGLDRSLAVTATAHPIGKPVAFGLAADALGQAIRLPGIENRLIQLSDRWLAEAARLTPTIRDLGFDVEEPPPVDGPGGHQRLIEGVARTLLAAVDSSRPGVLVFEDLHWADEASLEVIAALMNLPARQLVVLSYRDGEIAPGQPLAEAIRESRRKADTTIIRLERLSREDVAVIIEADGPELEDRIDDVSALTEGVPFFVVEYLAASSGGVLPSDMPAGIRDLLASRLAALDALSRQLTDSASVIGIPHDLELLIAVSGRSQSEALDGLERLLAAGLMVEPDDGRFDLAHNQIQQYAHTEMNGARRQLLHGRVGDYLRARDGEGTDPALAAGHFQAAGRTEEAATSHIEAARQAASLYANREALGHLDAALTLGSPDTAGLRAEMADLAVRTGDYARALIDLETAAAVAEPGEIGRIERKLAGVHSALGDWALAEVGYEASLDAAGDDPLERSRGLTAWAWTAHRSGDEEQALELARQALEAATLGDNRLALAEAHNVLGVIERPVDSDSARRHHEASLDLVGSENPALRAGALNNLAVTHKTIGRAEAGLPFAEEAVAICTTIGDHHREAAARSNLADLLHAAGRQEDALAELKSSAALFADIGTGDEAYRPEIWKLTEW